MQPNTSMFLATSPPTSPSTTSLEDLDIIEIPNLTSKTYISKTDLKDTDEIYIEFEGTGKYFRFARTGHNIFTCSGDCDTECTAMIIYESNCVRKLLGRDGRLIVHTRHKLFTQHEWSIRKRIIRGSAVMRLVPKYGWIGGGYLVLLNLVLNGNNVNELIRMKFRATVDDICAPITQHYMLKLLGVADLKCTDIHMYCLVPKCTTGLGMKKFRISDDYTFQCETGFKYIDKNARKCVVNDISNYIAYGYDVYKLIERNDIVRLKVSDISGGTNEIRQIMVTFKLVCVNTDFFENTHILIQNNATVTFCLDEGYLGVVRKIHIQKINRNRMEITISFYSPTVSKPCVAVVRIVSKSFTIKFNYTYIADAQESMDQNFSRTNSVDDVNGSYAATDYTSHGRNPINQNNSAFENPPISDVFEQSLMNYFFDQYRDLIGVDANDLNSSKNVWGYRLMETDVREVYEGDENGKKVTIGKKFAVFSVDIDNIKFNDHSTVVHCLDMFKNIYDIYGRNVLFYMADLGMSDECKIAITECGYPVNIKDVFNFSIVDYLEYYISNKENEEKYLLIKKLFIEEKVEKDVKKEESTFVSLFRTIGNFFGFFSSTDDFNKDNIESWSVDNVVKWVYSMPIDPYGSQFLERCIRTLKITGKQILSDIFSEHLLKDDDTSIISTFERDYFDVAENISHAKMIKFEFWCIVQHVKKLYRNNVKLSSDHWFSIFCKGVSKSIKSTQTKEFSDIAGVLCDKKKFKTLFFEPYVTFLLSNLVNNGYSSIKELDSFIDKYETLFPGRKFLQDYFYLIFNLKAEIRPNSIDYASEECCGLEKEFMRHYSEREKSELLLEEIKVTLWIGEILKDNEFKNEDYLSPILSIIPKLKEPLGKFKLAVSVGPWYFEVVNGLVIPKQKISSQVLAVYDVGKIYSNDIKSVQSFKDFSDLLCDFCFSWNCSYDPESIKPKNSFDFVIDLFENIQYFQHIKVKEIVRKYSPILYSNINGSGEANFGLFTPSKDFIDVTKIKWKEKRFQSHKELDIFVISIKQFGGSENQFESEFNFLKVLDRAFWMRAFKFLTDNNCSKEVKERLSPLMGNDNGKCIEFKLGKSHGKDLLCPFLNPKFTAKERGEKEMGLFSKRIEGVFTPKDSFPGVVKLLGTKPEVPSVVVNLVSRFVKMLDIRKSEDIIERGIGRSKEAGPRILPMFGTQQKIKFPEADVTLWDEKLLNYWIRELGFKNAEIDFLHLFVTGSEITGDDLVDEDYNDTPECLLKFFKNIEPYEKNFIQTLGLELDPNSKRELYIMTGDHKRILTCYPPELKKVFWECIQELRRQYIWNDEEFSLNDMDKRWFLVYFKLVRYYFRHTSNEEPEIIPERLTELCKIILDKNKFFVTYFMPYIGIAHAKLEFENINPQDLDYVEKCEMIKKSLIELVKEYNGLSKMHKFHEDYFYLITRLHKDIFPKSVIKLKKKQRREYESLSSQMRTPFSEKYRIKLYIVEQEQPVIGNTIKNIISPILTMIPALGPKFGFFHVAIAIGPWYLSWNDSSLMIPKQLNSSKAIAVSDLDDFLSHTIEKGKKFEIADQICDKIIKWNSTVMYSTKDANCHDFVKDILSVNMLKGFDFEKTLFKNKVLGRFFPQIRDKGKSNFLEFSPTPEFLKEKGIKWKKKIFATHEELDDFVLDNFSDDSYSKYHQEFIVLKAIDRAFWLRCFKFEGTEYQKTFVPKLKEKVDVFRIKDSFYANLNCPFGNFIS